jgi:hypothetical protein
MAQVVQQIQTHDPIHKDLDYLLREWRAIPDVAREWEHWDELDRLTFVVEWPLRVDRMLRLESSVQQHALNEEQHVRYLTLQELIARHQSTLDRLLAE